MVINVLCESSLIELNNPFSNMTLDEAFNMFTENVNIALNEYKYSDDSYSTNNKSDNADEIDFMCGGNHIYETIKDNISRLWDKFIEFIQNFTSIVMKKFLSIGIDKRKSYSLIDNMKEDFTITINNGFVTQDNYDELVRMTDSDRRWYSDYVNGETQEIENYFKGFRQYDNIDYKITRQIGINAWNIIFNSKSKFVSKVIRIKKDQINGIIDLVDRDTNEDVKVNKNDKHQLSNISKICKEEISVYRDYLKSCAKVLKAIINHGGDSKYKKNENDDE